MNIIPLLTAVLGFLVKLLCCSYKKFGKIQKQGVFVYGGGGDVALSLRHISASFVTSQRVHFQNFQGEHTRSKKKANNAMKVGLVFCSLCLHVGGLRTAALTMCAKYAWELLSYDSSSVQKHKGPCRSSAIRVRLRAREGAKSGKRRTRAR